MSERPLSYGRQTIEEDDIQAVAECLRGDWLTQGPRVAEFERALCDATGAKFAVAVSSGTAALHLAYLALGMGPGDLGVSPAVSFVATTNGMLYTGSDVAFADVDPATGLVDAKSLSSLVDTLCKEGRAPKVIAAVDLTGQTADLATVRDIARRCGARVVEDAAHSLGATYAIAGKRYRAGSCDHADAAILSFHPVKHVTTAEGGAITTNDPALNERLLELRTHGIHRDAKRFSRSQSDPMVGPWYHEQASLGFNYRITDMQCALGLSQMKKLDRFLARRREIAARYDAALATGVLARELAPLPTAPGNTSAYHLYVVQLRAREGETIQDIASRRKALYSRLSERKIHCQVHYIPIPWQPYYRESARVRQADLPGAARYYAGCLSIPMFPAMSDADIDRVVHTLEEALG
jgi:UDP-4-amino-4,6-dideoxy-N-acetyl-beta-L-altrosamine transaminase